MAFDIDKLYKDDISPGIIGGKIKRIRKLRGYTQKEFGLKCGFTDSTADVRIGQYEKNKKTPRKKALKDIADALGVDECALFDADLMTYNSMYHALFDLEDFHGLHPVEINGRFYLEFGVHTILGNEVRDMDIMNFLGELSEMYQQFHSSSSDAKDARDQKDEEYNIWRFEYPHNVVTETDTREINALRKHTTIRPDVPEHDEIVCPKCGEYLGHLCIELKKKK